MASLGLVVSSLPKKIHEATYLMFVGRHCCLWCHIISEDLKLAPSVRGPLQQRSDTTLAQDLAAFKADGANIKRAKHFNNVIREPLFTISIDQAHNHNQINFDIKTYLNSIGLPTRFTYNLGHILQTLYSSRRLLSRTRCTWPSSRCRWRSRLWRVHSVLQEGGRTGW